MLDLWNAPLNGILVIEIEHSAIFIGLKYWATVTRFCTLIESLAVRKEPLKIYSSANFLTLRSDAI